MFMSNKEQALQNCIEQGSKYNFISWDGVLDVCDENMRLVNYVQKQLINMKNEGKIEFELDF